IRHGSGYLGKVNSMIFCWVFSYERPAYSGEKVMYKNSEKFLTAFTKIEKQLKSRLNNRRDIGFARSVKILRSSNAIVRRYSEDLLSFAELRNAIVHNKIDM